MKDPDASKDVRNAKFAELPGPDSPPAAPSEVEESREGCRTSPYLDTFSQCLSTQPDCKHARPFGYCKFCVHPDHKKFWDDQSDEDDAVD
jgi:hypothetical protein